MTRRTTALNWVEGAWHELDALRPRPRCAGWLGQRVDDLWTIGLLVEELGYGLEVSACQEPPTFCRMTVRCENSPLNRNKGRPCFHPLSHDREWDSGRFHGQGQANLQLAIW